MKILSLFANVGFGEFYLKDLGHEVVVANELLQDRVDFYKKFYPDHKDVICGDISKQGVQDKLVKACDNHGGVDIIIATPPCQGMSIANAKKDTEDPRNTLIVHAMNVFNRVRPKYMLIENVPQMAKTYIFYKKKLYNIIDFIKSRLPENFECIYETMNGKHCGSPQSRSRSICLISKKGSWRHPKEKTAITTVRETISHLCSLESGECSSVKWHFSPKHNERHIDWMKNTPTGDTAFNNKEDHFPYVLEDGKKRRIYGFSTTYKRMDWNSPAPTVTMTNGSISSQNNVHPGNKNPDGTYSDARVLSIREVLLLCGLPEGCLDQFARLQKDGSFKYEYNQSFIRKVLGELFLPKMAKYIISTIPSNDVDVEDNSRQLKFDF